ncbi:MAG TPA: hypothetical protein VNG33_02050, partial [Polyangiaceae bacterium]|nr:hypothetical protein [Polyangiaceae bacterium]
MRHLVTWATQEVVRRLPYKRAKIVEILGDLTRGEMPAIVNSARMKLNLREAIQRSMFLGTYEPSQTQWFRSC